MYQQGDDIGRSGDQDIAIGMFLSQDGYPFQDPFRRFFISFELSALVVFFDLGTDLYRVVVAV